MKKLFILIVTILSCSSCITQNEETEPQLNWNGYDRCLGTGEITHPLWAGGYKNIGNVTYGFDHDANFYVIYDCSTSGWLITETHNFAGDKKNLPVDKSGHPEIRQFPNSAKHNPGLSIIKYRIPLEKLPPNASPGFVVASHCFVQSPDGQTETAWAEGDYTFAGNDAGWYDAFFYNPPLDQYPVLYSTTYRSDSLVLYHLDVKSGLADLVLKEPVGKTARANHSATFDIETCMFFFTKNPSNELWLNLLNGESSPFCAGKLSGPPAGGAYHKGDYYYVNKALNTLNRVGFTNNWMISDDIMLDTFPGSVRIWDIAMSQAGDCIYMIGKIDSGSTELIAWNLADETFYSTSITLKKASRIAFGSDNLLYSIANINSCGINPEVFPIDIEKASLTPLTINDHQ
jgi:hypothetical protein